TQFVSRLRRRLGRDVPLKLIFERPTVREFAAALEGEEAAAPADVQLIPAREPGSAAPLSSQQKRLWFLARLDPANPAYTIPGVPRATGTLAPALLQLAFDALVARHDGLRTAFVDREGIPVQIVGGGAAPAFVVESVASEDAARQRAGEIIAAP